MRDRGTASGAAGSVPRVETAAPNPWFSWDYVQANWGDITEALGQHVGLTVQAILVATALALPLALLAHARPRLAGPVLGLTGVLYTIPSLALFALLYPVLRDRRESVLVGLVMYALLVLVRNILVGLHGVDPAVVDAARGLGLGRVRLLVTVQLPGALPAIVTGLRLATVTTVALVTIGVVIGYGGLGQLMYRGFASQYRAEVVTATVLTLALALVADLLLWLAGRLAAPWARAGAGR